MTVVGMGVRGMCYLPPDRYENGHRFGSSGLHRRFSAGFRISVG